MGKKKTESTATFTSLPHVATADEAAYRESGKNADFHTGIVNAFGQAENDVNDTTFEEELPAGVGERIKYGRLFDLRQRKGAALAGAAAQEEQYKGGVLGNLAGMTQHQYAQTGGTTVQNTFGPALAGALGNALGSA